MADKIPIRLTSERWLHISTGHPEIADFYYEILDTIENPDIIFEGNHDAKIAIKNLHGNSAKFVVAIYKEVLLESGTSDGFIITAYFSNKQQEFRNKKIVWKQQP